MKFFSGFCVDTDKDFFKDYIEKGEFVVAGFSYGAQKALDYVLNSTERIDKLQLFSPAFFEYNEKIINLNIKAFQKNKETYIKNFLTKAGIDKWKMENDGGPKKSNDFLGLSGEWKILKKEIKINECSEEDLMKLFTFEWEKIKKIKGIKIEIYLGGSDRIIALKKAFDFFKEFGDVYLIKNANHFLRNNIAKK